MHSAPQGLHYALLQSWGVTLGFRVLFLFLKYNINSKQFSYKLVELETLSPQHVLTIQIDYIRKQLDAKPSKKVVFRAGPFGFTISYY